MVFPSLSFSFKTCNSIFSSSFFLFLFLFRIHLPIIMSTVTNPSTKKRKFKPRNPPGPDQAAIGWKEE
ncbi:hypothetical protein Hanom_Chr05g00424711 [Helianthus anomalus]